MTFQKRRINVRGFVFLLQILWRVENDRWTDRRKKVWSSHRRRWAATQPSYEAKWQLHIGIIYLDSTRAIWVAYARLAWFRVAEKGGRGCAISRTVLCTHKLKRPRWRRDNIREIKFKRYQRDEQNKNKNILLMYNNLCVSNCESKYGQKSFFFFVEKENEWVWMVWMREREATPTFVV